MKPRYGLQAKFLTLVSIALLVGLLALAAMLHRQFALQRDVLALSRESIQSLVLDRMRWQAQATGASTADALVNPLYNFDLEIIGRIVGDALAQPDVQYVTVYDPSGSIVHDGTDAIASYGQVMSDPLAASILGADSLLVQREGDVLDVAARIMIGDEHLGGVRIGYSLVSMQRNEEEANRILGERIAEIGHRYLLGAGALLGLAIALGIAISIAMQRVLIKPIQRLAQAASEIEAGKLTVVLPGADENDEIGELVRAFERMAEGIARRDHDIRYIANTDSLTGLANRHAFRESLDTYVAQGVTEEFALLIADIDNFKPVNDTFGHDAGDRLLCKFAERFRAVATANDAIEVRLARLGGDEFVLLARAADGVAGPLREILKRLADSLVEELSQPTTIDDEAVKFSASFGIAVFPGDAVTASRLMKAADIAMYEAKRAGKNGYLFFQRSMDPADGRSRYS